MATSDRIKYSKEKLNLFCKNIYEKTDVRTPEDSSNNNNY